MNNLLLTNPISTALAIFGALVCVAGLIVRTAGKNNAGLVTVGKTLIITGAITVFGGVLAMLFNI